MYRALHEILGLNSYLKTPKKELKVSLGGIKPVTRNQLEALTANHTNEEISTTIPGQIIFQSILKTNGFFLIRCSVCILCWLLCIWCAVAVKEGFIQCESVQPASKKWLPAEAFINGYVKQLDAKALQQRFTSNWVWNVLEFSCQ